MVWRGSSTTQDRFLACLTYLVPLLEVLGFGSFLFEHIPELGLIFLPLSPLLRIYSQPLAGMQIVPIVVFFALFVGVVQNHTLSHFLRFNAIQALLLSVFAWLCKALLDLFGLSQTVALGGFGGGTAGATDLLWGIVLSAIFMFVVGASVYSVVQSVRGKYAEIPVISEAAYSQTR